jgi:formate dehydrogenase iron-sulfur subunit
MTLTVYISQDTTAVAVGADRVAKAFSHAASEAGIDFTLIRNGSRGAFGFEPLVEVEVAEQGRVALGPVAPGETDALLAAIADGQLDCHPSYLGAGERYLLAS